VGKPDIAKEKGLACINWSRNLSWGASIALVLRGRLTDGRGVIGLFDRVHFVADVHDNRLTPGRELLAV
jgi:hypothetical protein